VGSIKLALLAMRSEAPVFKKPSKEDFVRMLRSIVDEAQGKAAQKASELQREFEKAVNPAAGYTQAMTGSLLPIHKDSVARAMELAVSVAQRSGLGLNELSATAEDLLKGHVAAIASLVVRAPYVSPTVQAGLTESVSVPFIRQIDEGVRDVRVGYIKERSIMTPAAETVQAKALRMLRVIYERTQSGNGGIDIEQVRGLVGLSPEDARAGWTYLTDKNLITPFNIPTVARINARGVDAIEAAQLAPDKTTPIFPSVTYNVTIHRTGVGSQVNVATSGSSQVSQVSQIDPAVLRQFIDGVRAMVEQTEGLLSTANLTPERKDEAAALLTELREGAAAADPDTGRLRRGLESLRRVMEHAAGHVVGMGVITGIEKLLALTLSGS
jgi:hypothetical protein